VVDFYSCISEYVLVCVKKLSCAIAFIWYGIDGGEGTVVLRGEVLGVY